MKNKIIRLILTLVVAIFLLSSCYDEKSKNFTVAFYNVENLFDTIDNPLTRDNDYLPSSRIPWNTKRYYHKLDNLSKVMSTIVPNGFPAVFGLCEVENRQVIEDLINRGKLKNAHYKIIHKDSPDERGIDAALLYQPDTFLPLVTRFIHLTFPSNPNYGTRDILYTKGLAYGVDTIHIFINHWVSRYGGRKKTEQFRRYTGRLLRLITDSIFNVQPNANILIAGDLNDNPTDSSILVALGANKEVIAPFAEKQLYDLGLTEYKNGVGSLYYHGWDLFDQIIVSTALIAGYNGMKTVTDHEIIVKKNWMLYHPKKGPARPNRTSAGRYYGGYSDHLPVFITIKVNTAGEIFTII